MGWFFQERQLVLRVSTYYLGIRLAKKILANQLIIYGCVPLLTQYT